MRMLILGGTEFLSYTTATRALARGHEVTCAARGTHREPPAGATFVRTDRSAGEDAYAELTGEWDAVVDVSWDPARVRDALSVLADRTQHWTYVSSLSVYADNTEPGADEGATLLAPLASGEQADLERYGEAKVACERAVGDTIGSDRAHIVRAGLIAGPMDSSDRFGYWPARFARDDDPVIVPDAVGAEVQVIAAEDLADYLISGAESRLGATVNATGESTPLARVLDLAQTAAESKAEPVLVSPEWLAEMNVSYWAGPDSLPLWLPADYAGFATRSIAAATGHGLTLRPLEQLLTESLAWERELGLRRDRKAGLSAHREAALLQLWHSRGTSV